MYTFYTDESILEGQDLTEPDAILKHMHKVKLDIKVKGTLEDLVCVNIYRKRNGEITPNPITPNW